MSLTPPQIAGRAHARAIRCEMQPSTKHDSPRAADSRQMSSRLHLEATDNCKSHHCRWPNQKFSPYGILRTPHRI